MPDDVPVLYFDLASPYAYLALERAEAVLGAAPRLQPVLVGAIFHHRGWGSWAHTPDRDRNVAELERRAALHGIPLTWPARWPPNSLTAMRAATYAQQRGVVAPFARAVSREVFGAGGDLEDVDVLVRGGEAAGLAPDDLRAAVADPAIKAALRQATDEAIAAGVEGVPSIRVGARVFWGDDRLETAALAASALQHVQ